MLKKIRKFISIIKRMKKVPGCNSWVGAFVLALDNYRWRKKGASMDDYMLLRFYDLKNPARKNFILEDECVLTLPNKYNRQDKRHLLDNKFDFNNFFRDFLGRSFMVVDETTSLDSFNEFCKDKHSVILKPLDSWCGQGIYKSNTDDPKNLLESIKKNGQYLVEEIVEQDSRLSALNSDTVNTIRILSLMNNDGNVSVPLAAFRIGRKGYCTDNFHSHGLVAAVDAKTGVVMTVARDMDGNQYLSHPDSGEKIIGFEIPNWSEVLNTVKRCALMVPELRYIGWDVAIGVNGIPLLIEGNSNSGVDVFQVSLQKGVRDIVNKGLEGKS